ncbi:hypothetical protein [Halanaerobaculum tunisiense]
MTLKKFISNIPLLKTTFTKIKLCTNFLSNISYEDYIEEIITNHIKNIDKKSSFTITPLNNINKLHTSLDKNYIMVSISLNKSLVHKLIASCYLIRISLRDYIRKIIQDHFNKKLFKNSTIQTKSFKKYAKLFTINNLISDTKSEKYKIDQSIYNLLQNFAQASHITTDHLISQLMLDFFTRHETEFIKDYHKNLPLNIQHSSVFNLKKLVKYKEINNFLNIKISLPGTISNLLTKNLRDYYFPIIFNDREYISKNQLMNLILSRYLHNEDKIKQISDSINIPHNKHKQLINQLTKYESKFADRKSVSSLDQLEELKKLNQLIKANINKANIDI